MTVVADASVLVAVLVDSGREGRWAESMVWHWQKRWVAPWRRSTGSSAAPRVPPVRSLRQRVVNDRSYVKGLMTPGVETVSEMPGPTISGAILDSTPTRVPKVVDPYMVLFYAFPGGKLIPQMRLCLSYRRKS